MWASVGQPTSSCPKASISPHIHHAQLCQLAHWSAAKIGLLSHTHPPDSICIRATFWSTYYFRAAHKSFSGPYGVTWLSKFALFPRYFIFNSKVFLKQRFACDLPLCSSTRFLLNIVTSPDCTVLQASGCVYVPCCSELLKQWLCF